MLFMSCCGEIENNFVSFDCYFCIHHKCKFVNEIILNGVKYLPNYLHVYTVAAKFHKDTWKQRLVP